MKSTVTNALFLLATEVVESARTELAQSVANGRESKNFGLLLRAYNRYQEDERDGVDYIFDAQNKDDIVCVLEAGMPIGCLPKVLRERFFFYGVNYLNYPVPKTLSLEQVMEILAANAGEYLPVALYNLTRGIAEYDAVYGEYVMPASYHAED